MALSMFGKQNQANSVEPDNPGFRPFQRYIGRDEVMKRAAQPIVPQALPVTSGFSQTPALGGIELPPGGGFMGGQPGFPGGQPAPQPSPQPAPQPMPVPVQQPQLAPRPMPQGITGVVNRVAAPQQIQRVASAQPTVGQRPTMLSLANRF